MLAPDIPLTAHTAHLDKAGVANNKLIEKIEFIYFI